MSALYRLEHLSFAYQSRNHESSIFEDLNFNIEEGSRWAVIGPSGCGKSTLLHLLAGLVQPRSGQIFYENHLLEKPQSSIQIILQNHGLFPWKKVIDNVALPLNLKHGQKKIHLQKACELLERLGLGDFTNRYPYELSGGQQQRVAIARALITEPHALLMDEPFSALDALTREDLQDLSLQVIQKHQMTSVLVTHQIIEGVRMADHLLVFPGFSEAPLFLTVDHNIRYDESAFAHYCDMLRGILRGDQRAN